MGIVKKAIKPMFKKDKWNILRGDTVKILAGKDRGQVGTVTKVIRDERKPRVIVGGINLVSHLCSHMSHQASAVYFTGVLTRIAASFKADDVALANLSLESACNT